MKTCTLIKQKNPDSVVFEAEAEESTATSASNIDNKKRVATNDAGGEHKKYLKAFAGSHPERHGKIRLYSIHNVGSCLSILPILYV